MRTSPEIARIIQPFAVGDPDPNASDRRRDPRWSYQVPQLVAFHDEDEQPTRDMLQAVRCHDISMGGISFFVSQPPRHAHCTLVLGRAPKLMFVRARIAHYEPTGPELQEWKIGCMFLQKLKAFPLRQV
jgi:hypothetical protein